MVAFSCASRDEVDELTTKAIVAGATRAMDPVDLGFMYGSSFYDLDGHHWEVIWIAPQAIPAGRRASQLKPENIHLRSTYADDQRSRS